MTAVGVLPGALVTTSLGAIPVEGVSAGDVVLTHRSRWRTVTRTSMQFYDGEAVRFRPPGLDDLLLVTMHMVWVADSDDAGDRPQRWRFEPACLVKPYQFVFFPVPTTWPDGFKSDVEPERFRSIEVVAAEGGIAVRSAFVDRVPYCGYVYDFSVEEDQSYVADGISVGSCTSTTS